MIRSSTAAIPAGTRGSSSGNTTAVAGSGLVTAVPAASDFAGTDRSLPPNRSNSSRNRSIPSPEQMDLFPEQIDLFVGTDGSLCQNRWISFKEQIDPFAGTHRSLPGTDRSLPGTDRSLPGTAQSLHQYTSIPSPGLIVETFPGDPASSAGRGAAMTTVDIETPLS